MSSSRRRGHRTGPAESLRFRTEDSRRGDSEISDGASVEREVATLFERFRLDLKQMFGRSVQKGRLGHDITHLMTGVAWGNYQDYLYGRWDGKNHEDEAQTDRQGNKISHGGDVYYLCPGTNYGKFLCVGLLLR